MEKIIEQLLEEKFKKEDLEKLSLNELIDLGFRVFCEIKKINEIIVKRINEESTLPEKEKNEELRKSILNEVTFDYYERTKDLINKYSAYLIVDNKIKVELQLRLYSLTNEEKENLLKNLMIKKETLESSNIDATYYFNVISYLGLNNGMKK